MSTDVNDILLELYRAICARSVYETAVDLPIDDLFYVGGQLQTLIRRAEKTMSLYESDKIFLDFCSSYTLKSRIQEAKEFRKYIVRRIRNGF